MINKNVKSGSFYIFGNLFNNGIAFLTIPLFTRVLSTSDYGIVNTYYSWVAILSIILGMTLHMAVRSAFVDYENDIDNFMSSITFLTIISSIAFSMMIIIVTTSIRINVLFPLILLGLIQGFSSAIITNYSMYLMMKNRYKARTLLLIFPNLVITIVSLLALLFFFETNRYLGKIIPSAIVTLFFSIIIIIFIYLKSSKRVIIRYWKYAMNISLPIIFHGLSLVILSHSDRIMLNSLVGSSEAGIYSLIYNFSMISNVFIISLDSVWVPWFIQKMKNRETKLINSKVKLYIGIVTFLVISILLISPEVLKVLAPKEYWQGEIIIPPILLSSYVIFIYTLYVNIEHFHKKTKYIALNTIIAASFNIILNFLLIPRYGMYAAAFTTLLSYLISFLLHYKYSRKLEKELFPIKIISVYLFIMLVFTGTYYLSSELPLIRWTILTILSMLLVFKRRKILLLIN